MIKKILAQERHFKNFGGLKTHWLFSFSDYYDPDNMKFGALRVFNDDIIEPKAGFPDHPHDTMEIITIVLDGILTHTDNMGNTETLVTGEIQRMSAGEGIVHSEFNNSDKPIHLYQLWFYPNRKTTSGYEQKKIHLDKKGLTALTSHKSIKGAVKLDSDASISILYIEKDHALEYAIKKNEGLYIYVMQGNLKIQNDMYHTGDQARISFEKKITLATDMMAKAIFIQTQV